MSDVPAFASTREALGMLRAVHGLPGAADATAMAAEAQAECLLALEEMDAVQTAARAKVLGAFTAAQGYSADGDYSPRSWLIHRTRITRGAAAGASGLGPACRRPPPHRRGAGRRGCVGVVRPDDLRVER